MHLLGKKLKPVDLTIRRKKERRAMQFSLWIALFGIVATIFSFWVAYYFTEKYFKPKINYDKSEEVVATVSRIMVVPGDETAIVLTVSNVALLRDILFFKNAQIGDKAVFYCTNQRSILFRPSEERIIEVASAAPEEICTSEKKM